MHSSLQSSQPPPPPNVISLDNSSDDDVEKVCHFCNISTNCNLSCIVCPAVGHTACYGMRQPGGWMCPTCASKLQFHQQQEQEQERHMQVEVEVEEENWDDFIDDGDEDLMLQDQEIMIRSGIDGIGIYNLVVEANDSKLGLTLNSMKNILDLTSSTGSLSTSSTSTSSTSSTSSKTETITGVGIETITLPDNPLLSRCSVGDQLISITKYNPKNEIDMDVDIETQEKEKEAEEYDCVNQKLKHIFAHMKSLKKPYVLQFRTADHNTIQQRYENTGSMDEKQHIEYVKKKHHMRPEERKWKELIKSTPENDAEFYRITKAIENTKGHVWNEMDVDKIEKLYSSFTRFGAVDVDKSGNLIGNQSRNKGEEYIVRVPSFNIAFLKKEAEENESIEVFLKRKKIKLNGSSSGSSSSSSNSSLNSAHYYCVAEIYTTALAKVGIGLGDLLCEINGNSCKNINEEGLLKMLSDALDALTLSTSPSPSSALTSSSSSSISSTSSTSSTSSSTTMTAMAAMTNNNLKQKNTILEQNNKIILKFKVPGTPKKKKTKNKGPKPKNAIKWNSEIGHWVDSRLWIWVVAGNGRKKSEWCKPTMESNLLRLLRRQCYVVTVENQDNQKKQSKQSSKLGLKLKLDDDEDKDYIGQDIDWFTGGGANGTRKNYIYRVSKSPLPFVSQYKMKTDDILLTYNGELAHTKTRGKIIIRNLHELLEERTPTWTMIFARNRVLKQDKEEMEEKPNKTSSIGEDSDDEKGDVDEESITLTGAEIEILQNFFQDSTDKTQLPEVARSNVTYQSNQSNQSNSEDVVNVSLPQQKEDQINKNKFQSSSSSFDKKRKRVDLTSTAFQNGQPSSTIGLQQQLQYLQQPQPQLHDVILIDSSEDKEDKEDQEDKEDKEGDVLMSEDNCDGIYPPAKRAKVSEEKIAEPPVQCTSLQFIQHQNYQEYENVLTFTYNLKREFGLIFEEQNGRLVIKEILEQEQDGDETSQTWELNQEAIQNGSMMHLKIGDEIIKYGIYDVQHDQTIHNFVPWMRRIQETQLRQNDSTMSITFGRQKIKLNQ